MTSKKILGVRVDDYTEEELLEKVKTLLAAQKSFNIATVGPEFLLTAQKDDEFKKILNSFEINVPEGFGLQLYAGIKNRLPGVDLMLHLCEMAAKNDWTVGLLGGKDGVAEKSKVILKEKFHGLKINFALDGAEADQTIRLVNSLPVTVDKIKNNTSNTVNREPLSADILFVALGHPKQEKLLQKLHEDKNPLIKFHLGMGVGGSFDYISGNISRAPVWMRGLGLEWLWRLLVEPGANKINRLKRILRAVFLFPLQLFLHHS